MKDQRKTPGAMVLVERDVLEIICEALGRFIPGGRTHALIVAILDAPADHIENARAMVEQTPAVGGDLDEFIKEALGLPVYRIASGGYQSFGASIAAKTHQHYVAPLLAKIEEHEVNTHALETEASEKDYLVKHLRESIAELRAEIERLKHRNGMFGLELSNEVERRIKAESRIAELEAQQGEAASFVRRLCDSAAGQPSVATGYLRDILDVLESRSKLNP